MNLKTLAMATILVSNGFFPLGIRAEDVAEKAGIAAGVTAGNLWFLPIKAISTTFGALGGSLSMLLTGNTELSKQIWEDTAQGPYLITPEVGRKAVGNRPELLNK